MANVPQPNIIWRGAHPNNFTTGRPGGGRDGRNTFHHVVGSAESAVLVFNNPSRGASSHFVVTDQPGVIFQCVSLDDTAWCDGNWQSNLRTVSMEHHGDWRFGYDNPTVRENSAMLVAWLRDQGIVSYPVRHRDVIDLSQYPGGTACPGDLPMEAIWNRATDLINSYNQPVTPPTPEWMRNRIEIPEGTVYAQADGFYLRNLNDPSQPADSRRFGLNQNFLVKGKTNVGGQEYYITTSSFNANIPNGLPVGEVAYTPYVPPVAQPVPNPEPTTPAWADSLLVDEANRPMYVLRATPLIDLENGHPYVTKEGKEIWYNAGEIIQDVSAHTIVSEVTYQLTEYALANIKKGQLALANGIKASDLSVDPLSTPPGTPANPTPAPDPTDPVIPMPDVPNPDLEARVKILETIVAAIVKFFKDLFTNPIK